MESLNYQKEDQYCPLPHGERGLPTIRAEHFLDIPMDDVPVGKNILEGLCFDRGGNLYFVNVYMGRIYFIDMKTGRLSLFKEMPGMDMAAVKIHKNGYLYVPVVSSPEGSMVLVIAPSAEVKEKIHIPDGHYIDDMVFDRKGGFYFTDLGGSIADRTAGIYYLENDHKTFHAVVEDGMISTNGIALSKDEKSLWVTEYGQSLMHWFALSDDGFSPRPLKTRQPYHFSGLDGPDSICIDDDGNLYVSICGQGRFLVFNASGMPIGNILIPEREKGQMLKSTHIAIAPGTKTAYMCTADMNTGRSALYRAGVYAGCHRSYQFQ